MIWLLSVFTDMQTEGTRLANLCSRKITQIVQFAHYGTSLDQCLLTWPSSRSILWTHVLRLCL